MFKFLIVPWILIVCGVVASARDRGCYRQKTYTYPCADTKVIPDPLYYPYSGFIHDVCAPSSYVGGKCLHECDRECRPGDHRTCYYHANIVSVEANNPLLCVNPNGPKCIKADGDRVQLEVINYKLPGPLLAVCVGDTIFLDVVNNLRNMTGASLSYEKVENSMLKNMAYFKVDHAEDYVPHLAETVRSQHNRDSYNYPTSLPGEPTAMHLHGAPQNATPQADGVPYVTQDPICPGCVFRHVCQYPRPGTFFMHSHYAQQRGMGMVAPLIVRSACDPHRRLYDVDSSQNTIMITDHVNGNILLNSYGCLRRDNTPTKGYISTFEVKPGKRTRFRFIANTIRFIKFVCWFEGHDLLLTSLDGSPIKATPIKSFVMGNADRLEVIINANQTVGNYAINCMNRRNASMHQVAIMRYKGAPPPPDCSEADFSQPVPIGLQFNTENTFPGTPGTLTLVEVSSLEEIHPACKKEHVFQYHLALDVNARGFQINNISFVHPDETLLKQEIKNGYLNETNFCNAESLKAQNIDCSKTTCSCTHVVKVPYMECVEFVLYGNAHPFHMHGYDFYVTALVKNPDNQPITKEKFLEMDKKGLVKRNLKRPPMKDVAYMPKDGVAILRIFADNLGPWLAHCHVEAHNFFGMAFIFWVGPELNYAENRVKNYLYEPRKNNICAKNH